MNQQERKWLLSKYLTGTLTVEENGCLVREAESDPELQESMKRLTSARMALADASFREEIISGYPDLNSRKPTFWHPFRWRIGFSVAAVLACLMLVLGYLAWHRNPKRDIVRNPKVPGKQEQVPEQRPQQRPAELALRVQPDVGSPAGGMERKCRFRLETKWSEVQFVLPIDSEIPYTEFEVSLEAFSGGSAGVRISTWPDLRLSSDRRLTVPVNLSVLSSALGTSGRVQLKLRVSGAASGGAVESFSCVMEKER